MIKLATHRKLVIAGVKLICDQGCERIIDLG